MNYNYQLARKLRKSSTPQEKKLWSILRNRKFFNYEFRRQFPIDNYVVDFLCKSKKIIIELDGGQHNQELNIEYDKQRTLYLESLGYKIVRFWNNDIDQNIEGVYQKLQNIFDVK